MSVLYRLAPTKADSAASNHANLVLLRFPSCHNVRSALRAIVNTLGWVTLGSGYRFAGAFGTNPHFTRVHLLFGFYSTNHRRSAIEPSLIFPASSLKCLVSNVWASSPRLMANIYDGSSRSKTCAKMGKANKCVCAWMSKMNILDLGDRRNGF